MSKRKRKREEEDESKDDIKYKGVYKNGQKFNAQLRINGKLKYLGTFDTSKEAAEAHDRARI